jgi:AmmeMemoRadiSam system protein B/AmmeMemoRadiSam system protein A
MSIGVTTGNATWITPARRPELTDEQKRLVLDAAGELVSAAAAGRAASVADGTLAGAVDVILSGVFVSLKRGKHLRSCCGMLGSPVPLGAALRDASFRTAREDVRFPPVSPTELDHLNLEVWLLFAPEPMQARGDARIGAVTVGKHGLQVVRGLARGLLLPGVPIEAGWDAERFLEQVCVKAGLHPALWKDDDTQLFTFEGEAIRGRVVSSPNGSQLAQRPIPFTAEEVEGYAEFCRANIVALLTGATPSYYYFGAPDGNVTGVVISVSRPGGSEDQTFSQMSLRPGVPLQSTLFTLAQTAAQSLARQGVRADQLNSIRVGLSILHDPAMHGTVADVDLAGVDPARRAVLVMERNRSALIYDHQKLAEALVAEAAEQAQVNNTSAAAVFSMGSLSTMDRVSTTNVPKPVRGPAVREPGVAGMFYPSDPSELERLVEDMLKGEPKTKKKFWPAAMVPHAGLIYSGRIAADVFKRIAIPDTVIVIGPKHTPLGVEWAVAPQQTWSMPGFTLESDPKLARQLTQAIPGLELDAQAHQREHAVEVELPFIAHLAPETKVVGIAIGGGDYDRCCEFADGLASVLREREDKPLLVISSDMNHFATDAENRRLDEIALKALDTLDPKNVFDTVTGNRISMCGVLPAVIAMETLKRLGGLKKVERVGYATTADVTGDKSRVVGYAGMLFG